MDRSVVDYYDRLAPRYDDDRFANSYGRFIDRRERAILDRLVPAGASALLDLACGTGRLSDRASIGADASAESLRVAAARHPSKSFIGADAARLPFAAGSFDAVICFHLFMHLPPAVIGAVFAEVARVLKPRGVFVTDIAARKRRALTRRPASGWHGGTAMTRAEFTAAGAAAGLSLTAADGVATVPVHRLPRVLRPAFLGLDAALGRLAPDYASYIVARFERAAP